MTQAQGEAWQAQPGHCAAVPCVATARLSATAPAPFNFGAPSSLPSSPPPVPAPLVPLVTASVQHTVQTVARGHGLLAQPTLEGEPASYANPQSVCEPLVYQGGLGGQVVQMGERPTGVLQVSPAMSFNHTVPAHGRGECKGGSHAPGPHSPFRGTRYFCRPGGRLQ